MSTSTIAAAGNEQSVSLFFRDGVSDKEYHASLKPKGEGWVVEFAYGRRGASLNTGTKTASPVAYEKALKIYGALVKEKTSKGYVADEAGRPFSVGEDAGRRSGFSPQLSNPLAGGAAAQERAIEEMVASTDWFAQEKLDGVRMGIEIADGKVVGVNRRGLYVALPPSVAAAYADMPAGSGFDGELVGDIHHVFDIVRLRGRDLSGVPGEERWHLLADLCEPARGGALVIRPIGSVSLVPSAFFPGTKAALLDRVRAAGGEGVVFKRKNAAYKPGRPSAGGDSIKVKFWDSVTARVVGTNSGKRSVEMEMLDGTTWIPVGNVTVPANQPIPAKGDLVEVRYLYAMSPSNALFQPTLLGIRTDLDEADCLIGQLKYKAEMGLEQRSPGPSM